MDTLKFVGAVIVAGMTYYAADTYGLAAALAIAVFVICVAINEIGRQAEQLGKALDYNFSRLQHLHKKPDDY